MNAELSHHDVQELLAAYALDAVEGAEAEAVELHLQVCARCRAEVLDHQETVGLLAMGHQPAPSLVWDRIASLLDDAPPTPGIVVPLDSRRTRRRRPLGMVLAAAAAAVIALLGMAVLQQRDRLDEVQAALQDSTLLSSAVAAQMRPDSRQVELRSGDGVVLARAVMTPDGTGFVWSDGLPAVPGDRTYQLWAVVGGEKISAGVLGADPDLVPFRVAGEVAALAITEEPAGGVVATANQPIVTGLLKS